MNISDIVDLLICPITRTKLELSDDKLLLISKEAGIAYPIKDGIPILLEEEAIRL